MLSCHVKREKTIQETDLKTDPLYSVETFENDGGWGYKIEVAGKAKIKQSYIPGISGNTPFDSETDARRVGEFVVEKMKKGKYLPPVTKHDLDSLMIVY